jgi:AAA domain
MRRAVARPSTDDHDSKGDSPLVSFLRAGPPPDRTTWEGWQQWRQSRGSFIPAPRLSLAEYQARSPRAKALHDLHRTATHVNLRLQETPMSKTVSELMRGRLQNNAVKFTPGTRDGLMVNGGGFQGKTETACWAAAAFEDLWRDIYQQLLPGHTPGTRDLFVPVAYCRLPVRATPKALCKTILDVYGDPHPATLDDLIRSVRDAIRDHNTTALLIDDITRLRLHRGDDQDTLDLIRELMDLNVTLVLIGVDIPGSGLLRGAYVDPRTNQWVFPDIARGNGHNPAATERRFDLVDLDPFDYTTTEGMNAFLEHLAGIEDQLRLLRAEPGMLTTGAMPEYLFRRTHGIVGLLRRLIEDGCAKAIATGEERLTPELLAGTAVRLGNLADLDPEAGEIPPIPQDVQPPKPSRKTSRKKPRSTVFDDHGDRLSAAHG